MRAEMIPATHKTDSDLMQIAIGQAQLSEQEGGIPIGACLVRADRVLGMGHNQRVQLDNPILHAEIDCLQDAGRIHGYGGCSLVSTLMPCYLCAGAVVQFGIKRVVAGESQTFPGALDFLKNHGVEVVDLDLTECREMMSSFIKRSPELWNEDIGL
jgi:cytosine/creatinine deaminase